MTDDLEEEWVSVASGTGIVGPVRVVGRSWTELKDDLFGPPGSAHRERIEAGARALARRERLATRLTEWLEVFGPVGRTASRFWFYVLNEGNPRDGLEWTFLNDGMGRPRLWYVWDAMRGHELSLYPHGLPDERPIVQESENPA